MHTAGQKTGLCACCVLQPLSFPSSRRGSGVVLPPVSTQDRATAAAATVKCCGSVLGVQQLSQNGRDSRCSMNSKPSDLTQLSGGPQLLHGRHAGADSSLPEGQRLQLSGPKDFAALLLILN